MTDPTPIHYTRHPTQPPKLIPAIPTLSGILLAGLAFAVLDTLLNHFGWMSYGTNSFVAAFLTIPLAPVLARYFPNLP